MRTKFDPNQFFPDLGDTPSPLGSFLDGLASTLGSAKKRSTLPSAAKRAKERPTALVPDQAPSRPKPDLAGVKFGDPPKEAPAAIFGGMSLECGRLPDGAMG